jgi:lysophospholipase L1-like esterase
MKSNLLLFSFIIVAVISCQKKSNDATSVTGDVLSSNATLAERVWTLKNVGKYSDQNLAAARNGGGIVFGGNSLMERMLYSNWDLTWQGYPVINRALGGTTWADQIPYIDDLFTDYRPSVIVLYHGENEYLRYPVSTYKQVSSTIETNFIKFYDVLRSHNPKAKIIICSMVACPELFKRGYEVYKTSSGTYIYDIDNLNKIYRNKLTKDNSLTGITTRFVNIKPLYQFYNPRMYDATKFDSDGIHIKLTQYPAWYNKLKPVVDSLYKNIQPAPVNRPWWLK